MATVSKAQRFAQEAEAIGGWVVKRIKKDDGTRVVAVRRGDEAFRFEWVPNPEGRGSLKFSRGRHALGDVAEDYTNVKGALRAMQQAPGAAKVAAAAKAPRPARAVAPKLRKPRADNSARAVPFDAEEDSDVDVLTACAGKGITWLNSISGGEEYAVTPRGGIHYKIATLDSGKRVLTFIDQRYLMKIDAESRGWSSVDIETIVSVG